MPLCATTTMPAKTLHRIRRLSGHDIFSRRRCPYGASIRCCCDRRCLRLGGLLLLSNGAPSPVASHRGTSVVGHKCSNKGPHPKSSKKNRFDECTSAASNKRSDKHNSAASNTISDKHASAASNERSDANSSALDRRWFSDIVRTYVV